METKLLSFRADEMTWRKLYCLQHKSVLKFISLGDLWRISAYKWEQEKDGRNL
jgi:hypothetical protein